MKERVDRMNRWQLCQSIYNFGVICMGIAELDADVYLIGRDYLYGRGAVRLPQTCTREKRAKVSAGR